MYIFYYFISIFLLIKKNILILIIDLKDSNLQLTDSAKYLYTSSTVFVQNLSRVITLDVCFILYLSIIIIYIIYLYYLFIILFSIFNLNL